MNMTMLKTLLTTFAILAVAASSSCARNDDKSQPGSEVGKSVEKSVEGVKEDVKEGLKQTGEDIRASARQSRDAVVASTRRTLETLGQEIEEVEHWAQEKGSELSDTSKAALKSLKEERVKIAAELDRSSEITDDNWDAFVRDTSRAMDKLEAGYNGVLEDMKTAVP